VSTGLIRTSLQFSLLLSSSLDIFEARARANASTGSGLSGDLGLLQALDERLALYGFETNTGVKFVAVVDMKGRKPKEKDGGGNGSGKAKGNEKTGGGTGGSGSGRGSGTGASAGAGAGATARSGIAVGMVGLRDGEMKVVFRAMQAAYVRLLQNPFYDPDEHSPALGKGGKKIQSRRFEADMRRIGEAWAPGKMAL
jgi:trafficking protein particle complex subunit 2